MDKDGMEGIVAIQDEIKDLETQITKSNKILDDINVPRIDTKGEELSLTERLFVHREQIEAHLLHLKTLLSRYS